MLTNVFQVFHSSHFRLDRIVSLLDTGHNNAIRSTAAKQIGQVLSNNSSDLIPVINKIFPLLSFKHWDTRTAAATAMSEIAKTCRTFIPTTAQNNTLDKQHQYTLDFTSFDIYTVLKNGALLLASEGKEFDFDPTLDPKERLVLQKKQIAQKLGLGTEFMDFDFFTDADLLQTPNAKSHSQKNAAVIIHEAANINIDDPNLSARERNRLKRKAKLAAKMHSYYHNH
jgi:TATA-binding protein-associated factor